MRANLFLTTQAPKTLSEREQLLLLRTTGGHAAGARDCTIISLALGTGLREHEILALDVGDVLDGEGRVRRRVRLRIYKGVHRYRDPDRQQVFLPDPVRRKIEKLLESRRRAGEELRADTPLFVSRLGRRLSARQLRRLFTVWQQRAGFERRFNFHATRHSAVSAVYRRTRDLSLAQKFGRHLSPVTTSIYTHVADEDVERALRDQVC